MLLRTTLILTCAAALTAQGPIKPRPRPEKQEAKPPPYRRQPAPVTARTPVARGSDQPRGVVSDAELMAIANNQPYTDLVLSETRRMTLDFSESLPNYICDQSIDRFSSKNLGKKWKKEDNVFAEVLLVEDSERYQNIRIDGREAGDDMTRIGGQWSTGEFSTALWNLFSHETGVQFAPIGPAEENERPLTEYEFHVEQHVSQWTLTINNQMYRPEYRGRLWLSEDDSRVYRFNFEALNLPSDYPAIIVESAVEYDWVEIAEERYLMPSKASTFSCVRGSATCFKSEITFDNYRKFTAASSVFNTESTIDFGQEAPATEPQP